MEITALKATAKKPRLARRERVWLVSLAVVVGFLIIYPFYTDPYSLSVVRDALTFGLLALSLDYLWGKTGTLSFGHAAFFGLGAYGMAIVALVVGYFLIFGGVRGAYFTIVTLAMTVIADHIAVGWSDVTGGNSGLIGVPPLTVSVLGFNYAFFGLPLYYLILALCSVALLVLWFACRGRYGSILSAIQDNELRARTLGHNTALHLLIVFILSAMLAGLAGAVYVTGTGFVAPDMIGLLLSTEVIIWVAIGGRGTLLGPIIGTFIVMRLQQEISSFDTKLWPLFIGGFFIAMVFLFPDGVLSLFRRLRTLVVSRPAQGRGETRG